MAFFDKIRSLFQSDKLDVSARFEFVREAVAGTMSQFHVVREIATGKLYGLKLLDAEKTQAFEARFANLNKPSEGAISVALKHPRIVETFEYGETTQGKQYLLQEYLEGPNLQSLLRESHEALVPHRISLIRQMAEALSAVHEAKYIHRDICPRNYICSKDLKSLKLIDFGLTVPMTKEFMQPGNRTGTPLYMAPEIVRRRTTDHRVDIFAFGVSAYRLCTFQHPWPEGDATGKVALAHDTEEPKPILELNPKLDPELAAAIMKCLQSQPGDRFNSMADFLAAIRSVR